MNVDDDDEDDADDDDDHLSVCNVFNFIVVTPKEFYGIQSGGIRA